VLYCPECGTKIENIDWKIPEFGKYLPKEARVRCPGCRVVIDLEDRASRDQQGTIEVVYH
jgi:DNA-directed RNA polymerase subunit RPC12/RpoP